MDPNQKIRVEREMLPMTRLSVTFKTDNEWKIFPMCNTGSDL